MPVTVTDRSNRLITGLDQENFKVFEGKEPQQIKHFSCDDAPVSIGMLIELMRQTGHRLLVTLRRYIREGQLFRLDGFHEVGSGKGLRSVLNLAWNLEWLSVVRNDAACLFRI